MNTEAIFSQDGITLVSSQIQQLKTLFPACFDKDGRFLIDKFQAEIAQQTDISREFYTMNWLGKSYARLLRNLPPETLISEDKTHNAKPENAGSQNLLIRGDNLEVLKHLKTKRNRYLSKTRYVVEQSFGTLHRKFRYARAAYFGLCKVSAQSHLKAMCLNLLKAANRLSVPVAV